MPRSQLLTPAILALLFLMHAQRTVAGTQAGIALIPSQWATEPRRTLADIVGIDGDAIYLFRDGSSRPTKVLAAGLTLIEWAEAAPDLHTVAYRFTYPDPAKTYVLPERRVSGIVAVDVSGTELRRFAGGGAASWSPSGRRLAVLIPGQRPARQDTVQLWDRSSGDMITRQFDGPSGAITWRSEDTLIVGTSMLVVSSGEVIPSDFAGQRLSPDRQYSMTDRAGGASIWFDSAKVDITESVMQVCGAKRLKRLGMATWVPRSVGQHIIAIGVVDDLASAGEKSRDADFISIIDVSIPELLATIPGRLVALALDGKTLVVFREDGIHFVPARGGGRIHRSQMAYGSGVGPRPLKAWMEMTSIGWSHRVVMDRTDTLEVRTVGVAPGDRIAAEGSSFFSRADSSAFRVMAIRTNGSVLMESATGLVPAGQRFRMGFGHRFIVTAAPLDVGTASYDAGEVFRFRVVPEAVALERFRNGTERRKGQSLTTMMGRPYTPKPDTTFDQPPRIVTQVTARMPRPWRKDTSDHLVYVTAVVDTNGRVTDPKIVLKSPSNIETVVLDAARRFVFEPARKRGQPVSTGWGFNVELKRPRSGELAAPEDRVSTGWIAGKDVAVLIRASAYYDSVGEQYCYSYTLENQSKGDARVTRLALLGCDTGLKDEMQSPEKWNGFICGNRPGEMGWFIWEKDPTEGLFGHAVKPGARLEPMTFKTRAPVGRVRWIAQAETDKGFIYVDPCTDQGDPIGSASGTIAGPVSSPSPTPTGR